MSRPTARAAVQLAVALRGDRGSQHREVAADVNEHQAWRSPSGVTEDRNDWASEG
ncbi:hypothetical protein [Streptomyces galilaeus]|uniref:Uncharacterized protein n=1 Tax=Streptomyces galilaeus TaxID=33899 RepID=A0ABW9ITK9_STRGJ